MTQGAITKTDVTEEQKKSKTQELRDWLDGEIKRLEGDIRILERSLANVNVRIFDLVITDQTRYWGLTSDERNAKMEQDHKKLEGLKQRLALFRSARELDVDIDAIEKCLGVDVVSLHSNSSDVANRCYPVTLSFVTKDARILCCAHYFCLGGRVISITQHTGAEGVLTNRLEFSGVKACRYNLANRRIQLECDGGILEIHQSGFIQFPRNS